MKVNILHFVAVVCVLIYIVPRGVNSQIPGEILRHNLKVFRESESSALASGNTIAWSTDGSYLAVSKKDKIYILDHKNFKVLEELRGQISDISAGDVTSVAFSPNGKYLLSGHKSGEVFIWSTKTWGNVMAPWGMAWTLSTGSVPSVAFSPDGKLLATGDWDNRIDIWLAENWKELKRFKNSEPSKDIPKKYTIFRSVQSQVRSIDFSPNGELLATGGNDRIIRIWSTDTWKNIKSLKGGENWISSVTFSPDGKYLASGDHDGEVYIWDVKKWNIEKTFSEHSIRCLCVTFSPDGHYLASGGDNGELFLYSK